MTIRRKNKKKDLKEKKLDEEEKGSLMEAGYISVSDRICLAEEGGSSFSENSRALRAHKPLLEGLE